MQDKQKQCKCWSTHNNKEMLGALQDIEYSIDNKRQSSNNKTHRLSKGLWGGIGRGLHAWLSYRGKTCPARLVYEKRKKK